jgi:pimeloyl-ACP methyl ester carboxylesterase
VDAGGVRLHIMAEGTQSEGRPAVVWFCGAHGSGALMIHLHRALRTHTRSILIDRAGTGWSETGAFPRTTAREAEECLRALDAAGERGPFVLVGHSFGGLLAANMARRRPEQTTALVLLDATPPDTIIYGPRLSALREMRRGTLVGGLLRLFGIHKSPLEKAQERDAPHVFEEMGKTLGADTMQAERALSLRARGMLATTSIFEELSAEGMARAAWDIAVYEGDLGDMIVLLVAPGDGKEVDELPEVANAQAAEAQRIQRVIGRSRERYMTVSTRSRRVVAPAGTGHNFPYEAPQFVIDVVRDLTDEVAKK